MPWSEGKESACNAGHPCLISRLGRKPLEKEMATHSSVPTWRIPWIEEHGGLQSMGSQRVSQDRVTNTSTLTGVKLSNHLLRQGPGNMRSTVPLPMCDEQLKQSLALAVMAHGEQR